MTDDFVPMAHRIRILIVEDHKDMAFQLSRMIEKEGGGYVVTAIAETLAGGLKKAAEWQPDITLLDLMLPDVKDWRETVAAIPQFRPPVIVVSDLTDETVRVAARKVGAENVFKKQTVIRLGLIFIRAAAAAAARREQKQFEHESP